MSQTKPKRNDPLAALRVRNYRLFAGGWMPASIGLQMQATALAWEIYERTHDPLSLGMVGVARALPTLLLALPAGQVVDMLNRTRVLVGTQVGFAVTGLLLALGSLAWERGLLPAAGGVWVMYLLVALTGCARVFNGPSRSSLLPLILPGGATGPLFQNAITWNSGVFQLSATLGPVAAGALIAATGFAWPTYIITAACCLWFAWTASFIRTIEPETCIDAQALGVKPGSGPLAVFKLARPSVLLPGMMEGVWHVWREKAIFGVLALDLLAVLLGGATALMPIYAKDILHVGPLGLGALKASPYVGAFVMALLLALAPPFQKAGRALLLSVIGFGLCTIAFGLSTSFWLSLAMLATLGALDNISVVIRHVLVAARTPDRLRGRVSAVNAVFIECSNELGGFESGLVAKFFGPLFSVVSGGVGTILVVIGLAWWLPELRRLGRLQTERPSN